MPDPFSVLLSVLIALHVGTWGIMGANLLYLNSSRHNEPEHLPSLSVCIPARNEADNLRRLLPSLLKQEYPSLEVHVWDDGSEDDTWRVLRENDTDRLHSHRGTGPPEGWVGKVYALYQCTRQTQGMCYLFLDADAELNDPQSLRRLVTRHASAESPVTSGFPRLRGGGQLLVSLVPYALLSGLPWPLVQRTRMPALSALNGQCWLIDADVYHAHEPHAAKKNSVLEDVAIGRYLKGQGVAPALIDVQEDVSIYMYAGVADAWQGFRKNAYLLLGGQPLAFAVMWSGFVMAWIVAPLLSPWFLGSLYGLKALSDRASSFSYGITALAPLSFVLGVVLQFDSALHHWRDRVEWKGRAVPSSAPSSAHEER